MSAYPNGGLLIDSDWLKQNLNDSHIRILDVRASDPRLPVGYRMGHIPGALALDPTRTFFVFENRAPDLASPERIAQALGQRGISSDSPIVVYDEWTGQLATMTFWVLRYIGHANVRILHGGWAQWRASGGPTTRDIPPVSPVEYRPHTNQDTRATAEWIMENAARADVLLLDVRTPDEYNMGHIPNAVNLSYDTSLDLRTQTFKDADVLRVQLQAAGVTPDKEIVTYCASGSRSSHMFVTLQLLGYPHVRNYDGSMADWYHVRRLPIE
jgi:thiosulfate/3-mercaptopyruvate sulfurtransferase